MLKSFTLLLVIAGVVGAQQPTGGFPHDYPGKPSGDYSPEWQPYFQVTETLPNVTFPLNRNWAGNIGVNRQGHPNNTLFYWAFEKENGSLTASSGERTNEPWGIWLNGGPGSSSLVGLLFENGPIHIRADYSVFANNFSWDHLADYVWVDQPVGTGFSTCDNSGFVADEDQMAEDFFGFLTNLVKVFPSLGSRPLYLTGESYAGTYIPYIMKAYFGMSNPPVKLAKVAIGDGAIGNAAEYEEMPVVTVIETYPQLIGYDPAVYQYFKEQSHLCGYDLNLTYPQDGHFPTLGLARTGVLAKEERAHKESLIKEALKTDAALTRRRMDKRQLSKARYSLDSVAESFVSRRDLTGRANGSIDPFYGCDLYNELIDYALNFSLPWKGNGGNGFDVYDITDALAPEALMDASIFLNDNSTRAAIHAPTSKDWQESIFYPFGGPLGEDPSVEPMAFFSELASNASAHNVSVLIYSGNDDSLVSHISSEVVIQNTTFGGIQGFTRKPSTPWSDDNGEFAGIVHQERNWTYVLVSGAGHLVPQKKPSSAYVLLRDFILGNNQTGLVTNSSGTVSVVGGESPSLAAEVLPGQSGIYVGAGATQSTYTYPSATISAWESFIATALPVATNMAPSDGNAASPSPGSGQDSKALVSVHLSWFLISICTLLVLLHGCI